MEKSFTKRGIRHTTELKTKQLKVFYDEMVQTTWTLWASATVQGSRSIGGGVCINPRGLILTACHVVSTSDRDMENPLEFISGSNLRNLGNQCRKLSIVSRNPNTDIALLKVESEIEEEFDFAGISEDLRFVIFQNVYSIYHVPTMSTFSLVTGYVSSHRPLVEDGGNFIQIRNACMCGDGASGCPVFNSMGKLIGLVSHGDQYAYACSVESIREFITNEVCVKHPEYTLQGEKLLLVPTVSDDHNSESP